MNWCLQLITLILEELKDFRNVSYNWHVMPQNNAEIAINRVSSRFSFIVHFSGLIEANCYPARVQNNPLRATVFCYGVHDSASAKNTEYLLLLGYKRDQGNTIMHFPSLSNYSGTD